MLTEERQVGGQFSKDHKVLAKESEFTMLLIGKPAKGMLSQKLNIFLSMNYKVKMRTDHEPCLTLGPLTSLDNFPLYRNL